MWKGAAKIIFQAKQKNREKRVNPRIQKKERIAMTAIYNDIHTTSLCLCSIISICTVLVIGPDGVRDVTVGERSPGNSSSSSSSCRGGS